MNYNLPKPSCNFVLKKVSFSKILFSLVLCFLFLIGGNNSNAQVCTGSSGPPVLLETFGSGIPNIGDSLTGDLLTPSFTKYLYKGGYPPDKYYTISKNSNLKADWLTDRDHTGNPDGYMMVVNSSDKSGNTEIYRRTVTGLCPNTEYTFAAYISNVNGPAAFTFCSTPPNTYAYAKMEFKIVDGGSTLKSIITGDIPVSGNAKLNWIQYGINVTTGTQTQLDIVLTNLAIGGCGNDIAIDDISFAVCGPTLKISANPPGPNYCLKDNVQLTGALGAGYANPVFQWQKSTRTSPTWVNVTGATGISLTLNNLALSDSGSYRLMAASSPGNLGSSCGIISDTLRIKVIMPPAVTIKSRSICSGNSVTLVATYDATISGQPTYLWNDGTTLANLTVSPTVFTTYSVVAKEPIKQCSSSQTATVTVNDNPVVTITPGSSIICEGESKTLVVDVKKSTGKLTYVWSFDNGTLDKTNPANVIAKPTSTSNYKVIVTDADTCSGSATAKITVKPKPVFKVTDGNYCVGGSVDLTASDNTITYTWTPSLGLNNVIGTSVKASPVSTTKYRVIGSSIDNCRDTVFTTVTVNPNPTVSIDPLTDSICYKGTTTLTAKTNGVNPIYTWTASPSDPAMSSTSTQKISVGPLSNTTYTLEVKDVNSCTNTTSAPVVVTTPAIQVKPHEPKCQGDTVQLRAYGAPDYIWSPASSLINPKGNMVVTAPAPGTYTYTVTGIFPKCNNNPSKTVDLTIYKIPTITVSKPAPACIGESQDLIASGADKPSNYTWKPDPTLNSMTGDKVTATPLTNQSYTVKGTANGCPNTATVQVEVLQLPIPFVPTPESICLGSKVTLNAVNLATSGLLTKYTWKASPDLSTLKGASTVAQPTALKTVYSVHAVDANSCKADTIVNVTAVSKVIPTISDSVKICTGDKVNLTAGGGTSYIWQNNDARTPSIIVSPTVTTKYKVKIMNSRCFAFDSVKVIIKDPIAPTLYIPNAFTPNEDRLNDSFKVFSNSVLTNFKGLIFDRWGEIIYEWSDINDGWDGTIHGTLAQHGVYVYKITAKSECETKIRNPEVGTVTLVR